MHLNATTLVYEERITETGVLPTRHTELVVELPAGHPWVGRAPGSPEESVAIAVDVRRSGGDFEEVARFGPFSEPTMERFQMPRADADEDAPDFISTGRRRSVFRCRLIHTGKHEPRVRMQVLGL